MRDKDRRSAWEAIAEGPAFYEALGRAIKVERTARGWERKELAERAGLSYPYLSEIEGGKKRPSWGALRRIAGALGVAVSGLLETAETWIGPALDAYGVAASPAPEPARARGRWFATEPVRPDMAMMQTSAGRERMARLVAPSSAPARRGSEEGRARAQLIRELLEHLEHLPTEDLERLRNLARELGG